MTDGEKVPTYTQWVKERQAITNEIRVRAAAYYDSAPTKEKASWTWIHDTFRELNYAFHALEWVNNYQQEEDFKLYQIVKEFDVKVELLVKTILGLDNSASAKDVEERAKDFGKFVNVLLEKGKEWQIEKELREKGR